MRSILMLVISVFFLCAAPTADAQPTPQQAPSQALRSAYCIFNNKYFSPGAILCVGERRGLKCVAGDEKEAAKWTTDSNNNAPENDGCKGPAPL